MSCILSLGLFNAAHARSGRAAYHASDSSLVTCARYEPIGSILKVTNPETGKTITVRVNGRGPYNGNRILDLSTGSFKALYGGLGRGVGPVSYTVVSGGSELSARHSSKPRRYRSRRYRSKRRYHTRRHYRRHRR
jgi:rare lipoprotein A